MAKRGETRPYRIRFKWDNGIGGTETRSTEGEARDAAAKILRNAEVRGAAIEITISRRDHAVPLLVLSREAGQ